MKHNQPCAHRATPALTTLIALLLTVALAVACHNDPAQPQPNPDPRQPITLRLALPQAQPNTRVDYEDQGDGLSIGDLAGKLTWQEGDQITVTYTSNGTATQSTFTLDPGSETTGAGHPTATFSGLPPQAIQAGGTYTIDYQPIGLLHPYTDQELADDPTRQPQQQTGNDNTTHLNQYLRLSSDPFASLTDGTPVLLRFSHSILKLRLRHLPADLGKLTTLRWTVETAAPGTDGAPDLDLAGPTRSITLHLANAQADADGNFTAYLAFAPGQTSPRKGGLFSVRLTDEPGKSYTATLSSTDGKLYAPSTRYTTTLGGTAADADGCHAPWQPTADGLTPLNPTTFNENTPLWLITGGDGTPATDELIATNVSTRLKALPQGSRIKLTMEKVKTVGWRAFYACTALNSVSLPAATSIEEQAFVSCTALNSVSLPEATTIGNDAFGGCTALATIGLPVAESIGGSAFFNCTALATVSLPAATNIESGALANCTALTTIDLPAATSIGNYAFQNCAALATIDLPVATSIGAQAFSGCEALTTIDLPAAESIWEAAFYGCTALATISLPAATTIGSFAFHNCNIVETIDLPAATSIGSNAFHSCYRFETLSLPAAESIGDKAFQGCQTLKTLSLPAAKSIGEAAFFDCGILTQLQLTAPGSITLHDNAFSDFNNTACTLTLNPDKKSDATGDATPKVDNGNKWWKKNSGAAQWKSITYTPAP